MTVVECTSIDGEMLISLYVEKSNLILRFSIMECKCFWKSHKCTNIVILITTIKLFSRGIGSRKSVEIGITYRTLICFYGSFFSFVASNVGIVFASTL